MPSQLLFERRNWCAFAVNWVSLAPRPETETSTISRPVSCPAAREFSFEECLVIADIVAGELARRGYRRVLAGSALYCAIEAKVVADITARELDLSEVRLQIEEAKWERC